MIMRIVSCLACVCGIAFSISCNQPRALLPRAHPDLPPSPAHLNAVSLNDPARPQPDPHGISLTGARNQWTAFTLQVTDLPSAEGYWIRIHPPQLDTAKQEVAIANFEPAQILPMPVDLDRAGFVRHTGMSTAGRDLPRALLPAAMDSDGVVNLRSMRDPAHPMNPSGHAGGADAAPVLLWVDLHLPPGTAAGDYASRVDLLRAGDDRPVASVPLHLHVYDFDLPAQPHLQMIGELNWDRLKGLFPDRFEAITPRLITRTDARYTQTVKVFDQLISLAQKHRTAVFIPRLQPTVKWAERGQPPLVDWRDLDSLLTPWLSGSLFADHVALAFWPLPVPDLPNNWNRKSQLDYWFEAATHFDQLDWLGKTAVSLQMLTPGRAGTQESLALSAEAAEILAVHPRIRVMLPLEDDQIQFASANNPKLIDSSTTHRLMASVPSLVFAPPSQSWPTGVARPEHWLRTDLPGLLPYVGAGGDEHDVRTWAFLAFLRRAQFILWDSPLPRVSNPSEPADPNELVWFYPGHWFGVDEPVPTIQLKWLRRAEQDFEYLYLAKDRGEIINAMQMSRLITKPVQIEAGITPDPTYSLMSGTTDAAAWREAEDLLAQTILLRQPKETVDAARQRDVYIRTLQWARPQERPLLVGRSVDWSWNSKQQDRIDLHMSLDIYNASDDTPGGNLLQWASLPPGWEIQPQPVPVPRLETYHVLKAEMSARFDAHQLTPSARLPMEMDFIDGFTKAASPLRLVLPVAASDRREGGLAIDGSLNDWSGPDALQDGPMVVMLNRPALQRQELQRASTASKVYSAWADENFYVAFSLQGIALSSAHHAQNFVTYKDRRAWDEDLCEILIQPVYNDPEHPLGQPLHIVAKPNGGIWVERRLDARLHLKEWEVLEGTGIRYASTTPDGGAWNGEMAIPWKILGDESRGLPSLLRFNLVQHKAANGESASWCGPVDFGRDDSMMGVIYLRRADAAGAEEIVREGKSDSLSQSGQ